MATEVPREARRRRILDRGSDRLAFITGQARSLSLSAAAPPPPKREGAEEGVEERVSNTVGPTGDSVAATFELPKCEPCGATLRDTIDSFGVEILAESKKSDESADAVQHNNEKIEPVTAYGSYSQAVRSEAQQGRRQTDAVQHSNEKIETVTAYGSYNQAPEVRPEAQGKRQTFGMFTAKKISSSISASENIRILCAVSIALLAVLSYRGYPPGETVGSLISFRPLYLILLTDSSLIFGILFTTNWKEKDGADAKRTGRVGDDWTDQMGKALEVVLIFQKMVSAAFLDCCLCAVIIICGVSFP